MLPAAKAVYICWCSATAVGAVFRKWILRPCFRFENRYMVITRRSETLRFKRAHCNLARAFGDVNKEGRLALDGATMVSVGGHLSKKRRYIKEFAKFGAYLVANQSRTSFGSSLWRQCVHCAPTGP